MTNHFASPCAPVERLQFGEFLIRKVQSVPVDIFVSRNPADRSFFTRDAPMYAVNDPLQNSHVLAETGPDKMSVRILAEPIHVKNARRETERALHREPMPEVIAHVITAKRQHRHRIAAHPADGSRSSSSGFRSHGCSYIDAGAPIECLVDERYSIRTAAAKNESADGHAIRIFPRRID